jgi:hypothetical protein
MNVSLPQHAPDVARPQARLLTAAERLQDRRLRARVVKLFNASTEAIHLLADLELIPLGEPDSGAPQSLAAWEELAPVMGQTVGSVNQLLAVAQETFPAPPEEDVLDSVDFAFGPSTGYTPPPMLEPLPEGPEAEIASLTTAVCQGLRRDVSRLGERLKNPAVVADPWNLVSDLLEFRGRLRAGIGELI